MKSTVYTFEDEYSGIPLTIEGEVTEFGDGEFPTVIITDISHCDKPLELWCLSDSYIDTLKDVLFQMWCNEVRSTGEVSNHAK